MYSIRINNSLRPVLITPRQLETYIRRPPVPVNPEFTKKNRNNHLAIVFKISEVYEVPYSLIKQKKSNKKTISLNIPALKINVKAFGNTFNQAKRILAFKTHREYCRLIICRIP